MRKRYWSIQKVDKRKIEDYKKKLKPLNEVQLNIIRGLLLSGKGQLRSRKSKSKVSQAFYIEDYLKNLDLVYYFYEILGSWVNLRPKLFIKDTKLKSVEKIAFNTFSSDSLNQINEEFYTMSRTSKGPSRGLAATRSKNFSKIKKSIPLNFANGEVLSFWYINSGFFKSGYFFFDLRLYSKNEIKFFINLINQTFDFKVDFVSNLSLFPDSFTSFIIGAQDQSEFIFRLSFNEDNIKQPEKLIVVYKNQESFFKLIEKDFISFYNQPLLFPLYNFNNFFDFKKVRPLRDRKGKALGKISLKNGSMIRQGQFSKSQLYDSNQITASFRKRKLIHSLYH